MSLDWRQFSMLFCRTVDGEELTNPRDSTFHVIERLAWRRIWSRAELGNQPFLHEDSQRRGKVPGRPDEAPIDQLLIQSGNSGGLLQPIVSLPSKPASKISYGRKRRTRKRRPSKNVHWFIRHAGFDDL